MHERNTLPDKIGRDAEPAANATGRTQVTMQADVQDEPLKLTGKLFLILDFLCLIRCALKWDLKSVKVFG